jgi:hypothetical protein
MSAGMGLICADEATPSYSATFAGGNEDSISHTGIPDRQWWMELASRRRELNLLATFRDLALANRASQFVIALSRSYLRIVEAELDEARQLVLNPSRFLVMTSGCNESRKAHAYIVGVPTNLENLLGGTRTALLSRALKHVLTILPAKNWSPRQVREFLETESNRTRPLRTYERTSMSDNDVIDFIANEKKLNKTVAKSRILRTLRDSGRACEYKRFTRIFEQFIHSYEN